MKKKPFRPSAKVGYARMIRERDALAVKVSGLEGKVEHKSNKLARAGKIVNQYVKQVARLLEANDGLRDEVYKLHHANTALDNKCKQQAGIINTLSREGAAARHNKDVYHRKYLQYQDKCRKQAKLIRTLAGTSIVFCMSTLVVGVLAVCGVF
ncbi:hypothetical protein [Vibrio phage vB_VpaP_G1]|uniref:Uncharacterized protein n=1 Tax=Vibrio phage vB_VpaP_G1 TaxID=2862773 RepID=A0AAE7WU12_9CAUD|nr:hypothetical protein PP280_gp07 [Vibrio phage vB_VpaP_G1]QYW05807.1 hypothetical protein [Vibrio phage vB_VpaP_G1]